jgi:hypothetical protein
LQGGELRLLAFIQRQTGRVLDQGSRLTEQARIVGQREQPGLAEMRHGEIGRHLARRIEQARRIAVAEVVGTYRLVVQRNGLDRRTGYDLSLGVLDHGRLHRVRPGWGAGVTRHHAVRRRTVEPFGWLVATLGPTRVPANAKKSGRL